MVVLNGDRPAQEVITARKEYSLHHINDQKWVQLGKKKHLKNIYIYILPAKKDQAEGANVIASEILSS